MVMGDEQDGDFVSIELVNQVVRYKYVVTKHLSIHSVLYLANWQNEICMFIILRYL